MKSPSFLSFYHFAEVLEAAAKYAIEGTVDALRVPSESPSRHRTQVHSNKTLPREAKPTARLCYRHLYGLEGRSHSGFYSYPLREHQLISIV
jgi:hypothetical protein